MAEGSASEKAGDVTTAIESDAELQAIRAVLGALVPLKREGRTRVLDYVLKRLGMGGESLAPAATTTSLAHSADTYVASPTSESGKQPNDIRSLTEEKA